MNAKIKIDIIIPVYNAEKYIDKCIGSLLHQTLKEFRIILVNDGSTDKSAQIVNRYKSQNIDKFLILSKENGGQSSARNLALKYISAEYVTFLDSDDYLEQHYLEILYNAAIENNSDMVISGQNKVDEEGNILQSIVYPVDKHPKTIMRRLNFSGKIYKTDYLKRHNMHFAEGKTYEDNPFNFKMIFLANGLKILSYIGYNQIVHKGSTTTQKIVEEKLPLTELMETFDYINTSNEINDFEVYEYTVLSFFTYFIFQANKKHMYMSLEDRKSDIEVIKKICDFTENVIKKYFPDYVNNEYLSPFKNPELSVKQKLGVWFFVKLLRYDRLGEFASRWYTWKK